MTIGYSAFNTPVGNLAPTFNNGNYTATFNNTATFTCASGETCAAGEYRQNVKGSLSVNGSPLTFVLCSTTGATLSNVFQQDGCSPPGCSAYGYRACPASALDQYTPSQATGCNFAMHDEPGFRNVTAGWTYNLTVTVQGLLINTTTGASLAAQTWTVNGTGTAPASLAVPPSEGLRMDDKVLWVDLAQNLITKAQEVHVVVGRSLGASPLSAQALDVTLRDKDGVTIVPVGDPAVHEFGDSNGSTASIVYTLASDASPPKTALLKGVAAEHPLALEIKLR